MAAVDYFLKIDGIEGESKDDAHQGEIDLQSWSWGETQSGSPSSGGGTGAGKVSMQDFHFVQTVNKASPKLMLACSTGQHIDSAVLTCRKAGTDPQEFLTITMADVMVTSYQTGGSASGSLIPTEQISLAFSQIHVSYAPQKDDGSLDAPVQAGYNQKTNKKT